MTAADIDGILDLVADAAPADEAAVADLLAAGESALSRRTDVGHAGLASGRWPVQRRVDDVAAARARYSESLERRLMDRAGKADGFHLSRDGTGEKVTGLDGKEWAAAASRARYAASLERRLMERAEREGK